MKKLISFVLTLALALCLCVPVFAAAGEEMLAADELYAMGLFRGNGDGFALDETATRQEALIMTIRLLGAEETALKGSWRHGFTDTAAWADAYIGYAYNRGLAGGYSATEFGGDDEVTIAQYLCFTLRALGYGESRGDFTWNNPWPLAKTLGLIANDERHSEYEPCKRGKMALISKNALSANIRGAGMTLSEYLEKTRADGANALSSTEIARRCSGAVFYLETYYDIDCTVGYTTGSGFFIGEDGIAVTNYHTMDAAFGAYVTTVAGESYPVTGVIAADSVRDYMVITVGKKAVSGNTISKFPTLKLGRSALVEAGDVVYAIGSPLGQQNSITTGIVSNIYRVVNGGLPYIQASAATAVGSSGGALINDQGEVIGITTAKFAASEDMSLCVPIDSLIGKTSGASLGSLYEYAASQSEIQRDTECSITAVPASVSIRTSAYAQVLVSTDCLSRFLITYEVEDEAVAYCRWGEMPDEQSCYLYIYGYEPGETEITVRFLSGYGNPEAQAVIKVNVNP